MGGTTPLRFHPRGGEPAFELTAPRMIVAGYTGRDAGAVAAHIAELAAIGVPPPESVPAFYELDPALLTSEPVVEVDGASTSGEVEPVLIRHAGRLYLGVGSDHTDRDLEPAGVALSKAACPKPVGSEVIAVSAGFDGRDWDTITVESSVDGVPYQYGRLAALRTRHDLLDRLAQTDATIAADIEADLVLFCGTVPLLAGQFIPGMRWQLTLTIAAGASLTHCYDVKRRGA